MAGTGPEPVQGYQGTRRSLWLAYALLLLAGLGAILMNLAQVLDSKQVYLREADKANANLAYSIAQHGQESIKEADIILGGLVNLLERGESSPETINQLLVTYKQRASQLAGLFVYDAEGRWLYYTNPPPANDANNSDRAYFQHHLHSVSRDTEVSNPIRSRSTGEWILPVSRRFNDRDGRFAGVVLATIRIDHFREFYKHFDMGVQGSLLVAMNDGTIVYRRPETSGATGESMAGSYMFQSDLKRSPVGLGASISVLDGVDRIYAYRALDHFPLVVAVSMSRQEVLAEWGRKTAVVACLVAMLVLALILVGGGLATRMRKRMAAAQSIARENRELFRLANRDSLTGISNRRQFDQALQVEYHRAATVGSPLALVMIDVDFFKAYNDRYGHQAGDVCLKAVGDVLRRFKVRAGDTVARYGGEEFAVLLPHTDVAGARLVAERIRQAVYEQGLVHSGNPFGVVTVSVGAHSEVPAQDDRPEHLLEQADAALYRAKSGGRNRVCLAEPTP
ncbi:sensor domain-containing diguanylate cyclase [Pseudomonas sp. JS3066]|jgi:diguanylate cyclase (GGDEF)-like protein|uniref:sensor domain-containing diguanylate cyclase n=1 Tax=unclassified Pseudomonas TaxID=196821 RepID=UPI000EA9187D|nr:MULTISPECIES: sensor domain-containing diguanylate cyclase [unclassified Pseudomonas]AYF87975.1 GGDEF domain-containing protein [Pseudomonas sp. DY-1]WVK94452.1 sensor domain-containing diguanylate cyclase [Pseudomonas sp. JS3066]